MSHPVQAENDITFAVTTVTEVRQLSGWEALDSWKRIGSLRSNATRDSIVHRMQLRMAKSDHASSIAFAIPSL